MAYEVSYTCQGQRKIASVPSSVTGDEFSFTTTIPFGQTRESAGSWVPDDLQEIVIDTDIAVTVEFGDETPQAMAAGTVYAWNIGSGAPCAFTGASAVPFTIINTAGSGTGEIRIMLKTPEPS